MPPALFTRKVTETWIKSTHWIAAKLNWEQKLIQRQSQKCNFETNC